MIDQLVAVTNSALGNEWYSYDAMGNRLASSNTISGLTNAVSYSVNSLNQYSAISNIASQTTLQYDKNGNLTNQASVTETNAYAWDIENRLVSFQGIGTSGVISAQYTYDPFGRRLSKIVNNATNFYLYADEGLIGEFDAFGSNICSYGYVPNSLWMNNPVFRSQPRTVNPELRTYSYYLNDHLGAPQKLVAKNGSVVWSAAISAFGETLINPSSIITNNLRISSQYFDFESERHNNTQRYYDPISGRYTSRDPLGGKDEIKFYLFCQNNPINTFDSKGLFQTIPFLDWSLFMRWLFGDGSGLRLNWDDFDDSGDAKEKLKYRWLFQNKSRLIKLCESSRCGDNNYDNVVTSHVEDDYVSSRHPWINLWHGEVTLNYKGVGVFKDCKESRKNNCHTFGKIE